MVSPAVAHRLPEVFTSPEKYDPLRFSPGRAEHLKTPHALIGFGGGTHKCTGEDFAMLEMKLIISLLTQRFELELRHPGPRRKPGPDPNRPQGPVIVGYRRR